MKPPSNLTASIAVLAVATGVTLSPRTALAHCDTLDGPVVAAARQALAAGDPNLVLIWVQKGDDAEIKQAFNRTLAVRKLNAEARDLADTYFFETLVRIHRAGEGVAYTGLKPAGQDGGPAIPAADQAIKEGKLQGVLKLLGDKIDKEVRSHFERVMTKKDFARSDVAAGREFVKAYVEFIHYVENLFEGTASAEAAHSHAQGEPKPTAHQH